jgi:hypothetical protein
LRQVHVFLFIFLKWGQKALPNRFIEKKRDAQLTNGKLSKNRYNKNTNTSETTPNINEQPPKTANLLTD